MDNLIYSYTANTNQLDHIADAVAAANYSTDIDNQSSGNYNYDAIVVILQKMCRPALPISVGRYMARSTALPGAAAP
ncbi:hypothetical protein [Parafilimonas terrae]|uniref:Uncharacterized protein n=1 Tax=Parafilimonas terrae TaxID=1465490 RepID=A0A1I5T9I3_9BACT|nr:hypothetical protein [Parafilimonas terrae]SFP79700.1 hypothetical protein SAMN05444277_1022 [Parafilimonas terrae]